jgi:hypothetical protein
MTSRERLATRRAGETASSSSGGFHIAINRIGQKYGRLTVIERAGTKRSRATWLCECECGKQTVVSGNCLARGNIRSCGCLRAETIRKRARTHGRSRTPEYVSYTGAKDRCTNPNGVGFDNYGGRGIKFLYESFEQFFAEVGPRPARGMSLERIDNDGNYEPGNCRWATRQQQNNNTRRNRMVTAFNRTRTIAWWSRETGVPQITIYKRLQAGWPAEKALACGDHRHRNDHGKRDGRGRFVKTNIGKWPRWPRQAVEREA